MACLKNEEIRNGVLRDSRNLQPPLSARLAQSVLTDGRIDVRQRASVALSALRASIESRGGSISLEKSPCGVRVTGQVMVAAGSTKTSIMARVGIEGKTDSMVIERSQPLDESVVNAVLGYGLGALEVSYRVKGDSASYVIRTNGSLACAEERIVQVAEALAGAAEIVERMLPRAEPKGRETEGPILPLRKVSQAA